MNVNLSNDTEEVVDDLLFEKIIVNVHWNSLECHKITDALGRERRFDNGYRPRTKHEIYSGLKKVESRGVPLDVEVVNLPYTFLGSNGKPAATAFTSRNLEEQKVFLVPDHTITRIQCDKAHHLDAFKEMLSDGMITRERYGLAIQKMERLDVGERVCASIIHEFGHILTSRTLDALGINSATDTFDYFEKSGYLDNCVERLPGLAMAKPHVMVNVLLEILAEDYRTSYDIVKGIPLSPLPHNTTFEEDLKNPHTFLKGVDIMTKVLNLESRDKNHFNKIKRSSLDAVFPFGEGERSFVSNYFATSQISPLTKERKEEIRKELIEFDKQF